MADAALDANSKQTITGRLNTDGLTITRIKIDASTHDLKVDNGTTGTDHGGTFAATDSNDRPTMFAVSETDGVTPVALYVTAAGLLLIDSS